eukprot:GFUD01030113.1.p1 GENE.GFUD01030113.1~~GFUD01030113.1.p1  ORF type:complete len:367 (-),score=97.87 GFUD01030113.1:62-1162(-)
MLTISAKFCLKICPLNSLKKFHTSTAVKMDLKQVVSKLESLAPTSLAEKWDNVGLLIEPSGQKTVKTVFLTNDLTEPVLAEALEASTDLIISYHPPLFSPFKRLVSKSWKARVTVKCVENKVAVFSPHTSWDSVPGGINSWLVSPYGPGQSEPVTLSTSKTFPGGFSHTVTMSGIAVSTEQLQPLLSMSDISVSIDTTAVTISCPKSKLGEILSSLPSSLVDSVRITPHELPPLPQTGAGQVITLDTSLTLTQALAITKKHLGMEHLRLAMANDADLESSVRTIAVCAGSGGSVLAGVRADLVITGEMSHHEVLDFVHKGVSVILADHSNTERGYLKVAKQKLGELLGSDVKILVSQVDRDPLQIV